MDTLTALAVLFTLADGLMLALTPNEQGRLPYTAVALTGLWVSLHGTYHKKCGLRLSCRTAAASAEPYRVTLDEGKWNGRDTYAKWSGSAEGFGSQIQTDDGAQRIFRRVCPLLLLGDLLLALLTILLGVLVLLNPFGTFAALVMLIGAALVFDGVSDLCIIWRLSRAFKAAERIMEEEQDLEQ